MAILYNRISNKELKERIRLDTTPRTTLSFYCYFKIEEPELFRNILYTHFQELGVLGRVYLAYEGINAQVSVPDSNFELLQKYLYSIEILKGIRLNFAVDNDRKSFWVLKIKVRKKIVADGITDPGFSMENKGKYVNAVQMNELLEDQSTIVIDMRNHYEYEVGHFVNAIEIPSDTFREQLPKAVDLMKHDKGKNIIMYCTGGIRCEKASAYMLHNGFENVFHLEGGVINYARDVIAKKLESKFIGKIFVFDNRLGEKVTTDTISKCHQCGKACDTHTNCRNDGCHLLFIQCDECAVKYSECCSEECKATLHLPTERRKEIRRGVNKGMNVFNKSKVRLRPRLDETNGFE